MLLSIVSRKAINKNQMCFIWGSAKHVKEWLGYLHVL